MAELDLGVSLFDRTTKSPKLTVQGKKRYQQAKILLRQAERIKSYAQGAVKKVEDQLIIALNPLVPLYTIDSTLEKMAQKFPYTQIKLVKLSGEQLSEAILNGEVHLGINLPSKAVPDNLDFISFYELEWVCVCSPDSSFADMAFVDNETLIVERQITCRNEYYVAANLANLRSR